MKLSQTCRTSLIATTMLILSSGLCGSGFAQTNSPQSAKNIVLVHGAWADGSCWSKVIDLLQAKGFRVVAVQNPLTSLADDVAACDCGQRPGDPAGTRERRSSDHKCNCNHPTCQSSGDALSPERSGGIDRASSGESEIEEIKEGNCRRIPSTDSWS